MGCDIHMVLERRSTLKPKWIGVESFGGYSAATLDVRPADYKNDLPKLYDYLGFKIRGRNYQLFAKLAGVRGPGPEPRGIPDDVSDLAQEEIEQWGSDGHSHSWGLLSEIGPIFAAHYIPDKLLTENRAKHVGELFGVYVHNESDPRSQLSNYRLIYWFDN